MWSDEARLRIVISERGGKWPKQLIGSGVMFYDGLRITIDQFREEAIRLGYKFEIKE